MCLVKIYRSSVAWSTCRAVIFLPHVEVHTNLDRRDGSPRTKTFCNAVGSLLSGSFSAEVRCEVNKSRLTRTICLSSRFFSSSRQIGTFDVIRRCRLTKRIIALEMQQRRSISVFFLSAARHAERIRKFVSQHFLSPGISISRKPPHHENEALQFDRRNRQFICIRSMPHVYPLPFHSAPYRNRSFRSLLLSRFFLFRLHPPPPYPYCAINFSSSPFPLLLPGEEGRVHG